MNWFTLFAEINNLKDITYDNYYSFFFLYDKNKIKIYINNSNILTQNEK